MTRQDGVLLLSRTLTVYLILWVLTDLTYLPQLVFSLVRYSQLATGAAAAYHREFDLISLGFHLTKILGLSIAAVWFYNCGPGVSELLLPTTADSPQGAAESQS
jgi:hypothetical protein